MGRKSTEPNGSQTETAELKESASHASEIVPNFTYAAKRVFEIFLPPIDLQITQFDAETAELEGSVTFKADCQNGEFSLIIPEGDRNKKPVCAVVSIGGISCTLHDYEALNDIRMRFVCYPKTDSSMPEGFAFTPDDVIRWGGE